MIVCMYVNEIPIKNEIVGPFVSFRVNISNLYINHNISNHVAIQRLEFSKPFLYHWVGKIEKPKSIFFCTFTNNLVWWFFSIKVVPTYNLHCFPTLPIIWWKNNNLLITKRSAAWSKVLCTYPARDDASLKNFLAKIYISTYKNIKSS